MSFAGSSGHLGGNFRPGEMNVALETDKFWLHRVLCCIMPVYCRLHGTMGGLVSDRVVISLVTRSCCNVTGDFPTPVRRKVYHSPLHNFIHLALQENGRFEFNDFVSDCRLEANRARPITDIARNTLKHQGTC